MRIVLRKRICHYNEPGHAHLLTFSCYRRYPLLSKDRSRRWMLESIARARTKFRFDLWAWVLMPEHVHLLINPREREYDMDKVIAALKGHVAVRAIRYLEVHAPRFLNRLTVVNRNRTYRRFWQAGPGWDNNRFEAESFHAAIDYTHTNPIRRDLAPRAEEWYWSSAADWAGLRTDGLLVDRTVPRLDLPR